jgi:hypothetical protein
MLLFFTTLFFILFVMLFIEAFATMIYNSKNNKYLGAHIWWVPAIIGGVWFYLLMIYLQ